MRDRVRIRRATRGDAPSIEELIPLSVRHLARGFYTPLQIESALRFAFGLDSQLIDGGTYLVAASGERRTVHVDSSSAQCQWSATSDVPWITIIDGRTRSG